MNKARFDAAAKDWDKNHTRITMATKITSQIIKNIPLQNEHTVMDFGCGTGLVGLNIAPLVGKLIGADLSSEMLQSFEAKAKEQELENVHTMQLAESADFGEHKFDAIVSAMTMHHVKEPHDIFAKFAACIKTGGFVGIADLAKEDGSFHSDNTGVYHFGFSENEFEEFFTKNGFEKPTITVAHTIEKPHANFDILFCFARKIK